MSKKRKSSLISYVAIACFLSVTATSDLGAFSLSPPREGDRPARKNERRRSERRRQKPDHQHVKKENTQKNIRLDLLRESFEALLDTQETDNRVYEDPDRGQITDSRFEPERERIDNSMPPVESDVRVFPNLSRLTKKSFLEFLAKEASLTPKYSDRYAGRETEKVMFDRAVASRLARLVNDSIASRYQDDRSTEDDHIKGISFDAERERRSNVGLFKTKIKHLSDPSLHDKQARALELIREDYEAEYGDYITKDFHPEEGKVYFDPFSRLSVLELVKNTRAEEKSDPNIKEQLAKNSFDKAELTADDTCLSFALPDITMSHIFEREFEPLLDVKGVLAAELLKGKDFHEKVRGDALSSHISLDHHRQHHVHEYVDEERNLKLSMQPITKEWSFETKEPFVTYDNILETKNDFAHSGFQFYFAQQDVKINVEDHLTQMVEFPQEKKDFEHPSHLEIAVVAYYALKHLDEATLTNENLQKALEEQRKELLAQLTSKDIYKSAKIIREHQFVFTEEEKEHYKHLFTDRKFEEPHFAMLEHQAPFDPREDLPFINLFRGESLISKLEQDTPGNVNAEHYVYYTKTPHSFEAQEESSTIAIITKLGDLVTYYGIELCEPVDFKEPEYLADYDMRKGADLLSEYELLAKQVHTEKVESLVASLIEYTHGKVDALFEMATVKAPLSLEPFEQESGEYTPRSKVKQLETPFEKNKGSHVAFVAPERDDIYELKEDEYDRNVQTQIATLPRKSINSLVVTLFDTTKDKVRAFSDFIAKGTPLSLTPKEQSSSITAKAKLSELKTKPVKSKKNQVSFNNQTKDTLAAVAPNSSFKQGDKGFDAPISTMIRKNTKSLVTTLFDTTKDGVQVFKEAASKQTAIAIAPKPQTSSITAKAMLSELKTDPSKHQDGVAFQNQTKETLVAKAQGSSLTQDDTSFDAPNSSLIRKHTKSLVTTLFDTTKDGVKIFQDDAAKQTAIAIAPKPQATTVSTKADVYELQAGDPIEKEPDLSFQEKESLEIAYLRQDQDKSCYELTTKELARRKMQSLIAYTYEGTKEKLKNRFENVAKVVSIRKLVPSLEEGSILASIHFDLLTTVYDSAVKMPTDFSYFQYPLACVFSEIHGEDFVKYQGLQFLSSNLVTLDNEESIKELGFDNYYVEAYASESSAKSLQEDDTLDRDFVLGSFAFNELIFKDYGSRNFVFNPFSYQNNTPSIGKAPEFLEYGKLYMERLADGGMDYAYATVEEITRSVGKPNNLIGFEDPKRYSLSPFCEKDIPQTTWSYGIIAGDFMIATTYEDYDFKDFYSIIGKVHFAFNTMYYPAPEIEVEKEYKAQDFYQFAFSSFLQEHSQDILTDVGSEVKLNNLACWKNPDFEKTKFLANENLFVPDIEGHSLIMDLAEQAKTSRLPQLVTQSEHLPSLINAATAFVPSVQTAISRNKNNRVIDENLHTLPTLDELNTTTFSSEFGAELEIIPNTKEGGYLFAITLDIENKKQFERPPQNFIFMVDRSGAIDKNRFQVFKQAVAKSLMYLKEGDTFNIVTFDSQVTPMSHDGVFFSASTKHGAKRFLESQKRSYKYALPDIYDVLLHANHLAKKSDLPTTVFLLTNGKTLEEFDTQSESLSQIVALNKDHFSLFTACASHSNNNLMLEILSSLNKGEFLHSQTHAAFPRKFAAFVKHASHLMANNIHITAAKSNQNANLWFYPNESLTSNLYIDKPYTIIGKIDRLSDFELIVQGKFGDQWLNLKKNISFKNAKKGGRYIYRDYGMHIAYSKYKEFLKEGNTVCLDEAKQVLKPLNIGSIY